MSESIPAFVTIGDAVLYQKIQDEAVLLNMESQQYFGLNPTASEMWNQLVELHDVQAAEDRLCTIFHAEPEVLRADLRNLVLELVGAGLLKSSAGADLSE